MELYKTKDLHEAAFLLAKGIRLIELEKDAGFSWFVFEERDASLKLANDYYNNKATIKGKLYADCLKTLKDRLYADVESRRGRTVSVRERH